MIWSYIKCLAKVRVSFIQFEARIWLALHQILQVEKWEDPETGQSTGRIKHPDSLLRAVDTLVKRSKVNAIAIVGRFPDDEIDDVDDYRQGMVWQ